MNEPNPYDSPGAQAKPPEKKKWKLTLVEIGVIFFIIAILIGLLIPPVTSVPRINSRLDHSMNQLKSIGLALDNYHDVYGTLPPTVVTDSDGRPLYSWRVLILPFLEQPHLYDQFDLAQPWDSETNLPLAEQVPSAYESPFLVSQQSPGMTTYLAVVDPDKKQTLFLSQEGRSLDELHSDPGAAVLVVEQISRPVIWSKPGDTTPFELLDPSQIEQNIVSVYPLLFGNGSVDMIPHDDRQTLWECLFCEEPGIADEASARP